MTSAVAHTAWAILAGEGGPSLGNIRVFETQTSTPGGPVLLALDEGGSRHMLVPLGTDERFVDDTESAGVHVVGRVLVDAGRSRRFADILCRFPHLDSLFSELCDEMLTAISSTDGGAARACLAELARWRELLEPERGSLLGPNALSGLCGELLMLERVVRLDPLHRADCWWGADRDRHDIRRGRRSLEVKASTIRQGRFPEIHGLEQLAAPPDGVLHLAWVRLERVDADGVTVPDLVERLLAMVSDRADLLARLRAVGYRMEDARAYRTVRFSVREELIYEVNDRFPRIVPTSFSGGRAPAGIVRLAYVVDLSGSSPTALSEEDALAALRAIAEGE
jgi:Putative  PD-(D/E)XK family member, (DUF4420)